MIDIRQGELPGALGGLEDESCDACLTDPSYGLSECPPIRDVLAAWLAFEDYDHKPGFLQRNWDQLPPGPHHWREVYRVLKPGGLVLAFSSSRTMGLLDLSLRLAGFEILPAFAELFGSAMAQGANVGKLIDKAAGAEREVVGTKLGLPGYADTANTGKIRPAEHAGGYEGYLDITAPATPLARLYDAYHTRLRGTWEPVLCAMKPLPGGLGFAGNAALGNPAGFNAGACRIPAGPDLEAKHRSVEGQSSDRNRKVYGDLGGERTMAGFSSDGRFPSTTLISCHCEGEHEDGCPVAVLREQGGVRTSGKAAPGGHRRSASLGYQSAVQIAARSEHAGQLIGDSGFADRFFFTARASTRERNAGLQDWFWRREPKHPDGWARIDREEFEAIGERDYRAFLESGGPGSAAYSKTMGGGKEGTAPGQKPRTYELQAEAARERNRLQGNPHPCVSPLAMVQYLARLILPPTHPGQDPPQLLVTYSGSGSEVIGGMLGGWKRIVAFEHSEQMVAMSRARCDWWRKLLDEGAEPDIRRLLTEGDKIHEVLSSPLHNLLYGD